MHPELLLAAAKDPPIIDLDSTIFLQLLIFLVTMAVLSRYLFGPYLKVKTERARGIEGARDEARRMGEEAEARVAEYDRAFDQARSRANAERATLQGEAVARERAILEDARKNVQGQLEAARGKLAAESSDARAQLQPRAQEIAGRIAEKILGRKVA
jgi:F-type H+-transporting ATPase subunit b